MTTTPRRIYVACLASYNAGILHGRWIDANQDPDDIAREVAQMLEASPADDAEEWAIHDTDGFPPGVIGEHTDLDTVAKLAEFFDEYGDLGEAIFDHFDGYCDLDNAREAIEDHYAGEWDSLADFAADMAGDDPVPDHLANYIDWSAMGRDMELGGDIWTIEGDCGSVHVFWSH